MIDHIDHLVLTTRDKAKSIYFYTQVLGMALDTFGAGRIAFKFGEQKINLHEVGLEFLPKAAIPTPGSLDLCFIAGIPLEQVIVTLGRHNIPIIEGPVQRTGANWPIRSVYVRDPDNNLIEISEKATTIYG
ncbi:VOC family protein [Glaciimonas immobilis]|uniref:Catechol 2,3-dioxygenase-like lactoylglutathione lyase family enzyme n=1 Tax=Glaciimonas immobilis TaxID=728004 RepID=A0A840RRI6_9BURK|nr:VOC family protein [Glaciimonas immobilis]KAF3996545.1 VOC family protein [Glaciimonas immobilis]MBB5201087.1 catechol 2,3-dioxygenase-like lactoylglutathione lyase family enzyme [Glaciimonas immobilis]